MSPASQPTVSVIVVSWNRPEALKRALVGISQLQYPAFEVVVVADAEGLAAAQSLPFGAGLKTVAFEIPNISAARNCGIAHAAGEVVAFVDDDAVPETGWLHHLAAPFARAEVAAAGGFVRGRNGIGFQWRAQSVDGTGQAYALEITGTGPVVLTPDGERAIKTEGTNMAFRRDVLVELGGFDPAFRYYLDETDLNLRLAATGAKTAIVPLAEVHHGYAENQQRTAARVPKNLFEIGASQAVFLRKHCAEPQRAEVWRAFCRAQRKRLVAHMVDGNLMPGDVHRLMRGLHEGYVEGMAREFNRLPTLARAPVGFTSLEVARGPQVVISGRYWRRRALEHQAQKAVRDGERPSVFVFSRTAMFHRVRFEPGGYWIQIGGLFGRSDRRQPLFRLRGFRTRVQLEVGRVALQRLLPEYLLTAKRRHSQRRGT